jgi:hypothetical protein
MKIREIIKTKLVKSGFDKNENLIENIEKLMTPSLEKKAEKLLTPGLIKRAVVAMLSKVDQNQQELELK